MVWLYFRYTLSFRDVGGMLASRGIIVTYETIQQWNLKFGQTYTNTLRRKQAKRGDKWFLDEVILTIKGQHHYLWRAVDQDDFTLDILNRVGAIDTLPPSATYFPIPNITNTMD